MSALDYRRDIDGLRAIAVLAVVLFHAKIPGIRAGYLGVDIFFVISGYLITSLIVRDMQLGTFSLAGFWERRCRRIVPALAVMILATLGMGWWISFAPDYRMLGGQVMAQAAFSSNMLFAGQAGYFDAAIHMKPLLHTWSLAVEEQFYLLFPLLLVAVSSRRLPFLFPALMILSYLACVWGSFYYPFQSFYLLPMRAWELLIGACTVVLPAISLKEWERNIIAALGSLFIFVPILMFPGVTTHPWAAALLPCLGTATLIWIGETGQTYVSRVLSWKILTGIGLISYSLYLWHWPLLVFAGQLSIEPLSPALTVIVILTSSVLAYLSWRFVEMPVRQRVVLPQRKHIFRASIAAFTALLAAGWAIQSGNGFPGRWPETVSKYAAASAEINTRSEECHQREPTDLVKSGPCLLGDKNVEPSSMIVGDSFAEALLPMLDRVAQERSASALYASYNSCPPLLGIDRPDHQKSWHCRDFNDAVFSIVKERKIKTIVLIARWSAYIDLFLLDDGKPGMPDQIFDRAFSETVQAYRDAGVKVWVVASSPTYTFDIPRYLARVEAKQKDTKILNQALYNEHLSRQAAVQSVFDKFPDVHVIDPAKVLCPDKTLCLIAHNGDSLYKDSHHLSREGARRLGPLFAKLFD